MTKEAYLRNLDKILDAIDDVAIDTEEPLDNIELLRLQFDIVTAAYNCSNDVGCTNCLTTKEIRSEQEHNHMIDDIVKGKGLKPLSSKESLNDI